MTLIEMMIVIVVLAIAATGVSYGFGLLDRTKLRSACMRVAGGARFAYARAVSHGTTVRLSFDFAANTMAVEEAAGMITLARADDARRREMDEREEDHAGVDPWAAAQARLADTVRPSFGSDPFGPIATDDGTPIRRYAATPMGSGIRLVKLFVQHEPEPRTEGKGTIYFFRSGRSERAVLQIADHLDHIYSISVDPLTGRARVESEAIEPEEMSENPGDESDVEER